MTQEKIERNTALYADYQLGMKVIDLVAKYRIDSSVVTRIINRMKNRDRLLDVIPSMAEDQV
jgi:Mor family transcriptional regulator